MYIKVTPGNEAVGIQKHTLYVISYKLPWVLRPKYTIIRNSPFLLKDQRYFLLSSIIIAQWGELFVCHIPVHFLHVNITVSYDLTSQKLLCGKARNTVDPLKEREEISK